MTRFEDVYNLFFSPGEVVEIRAYGLKGKGPWEGWAGGAGIVYGYFDNARDFGTAAMALEKAKAPGIYFTLNPCRPELLARAANRLRAADAKSPTTADKDIKCVRWIPIDLDPVRPSGISSSDEELARAIHLRNEIWRWLQGLGIEPAVPAVSGNGAHLLIRIPDSDFDRTNPGESEIVGLVKACLAAVAAKFPPEKTGVEIDQKVFNPARIWKLYGTTARKGDHTKERPHRKSYIDNRWTDEKRASKDG